MRGPGRAPATRGRSEGASPAPEEPTISICLISIIIIIISSITIIATYYYEE